MRLSARSAEARPIDAARPSDARSLSVRARLLIVAGLCALLAAVPTTQLGLVYASDLGFVQSELSGLPANRAWHEVLAALQAHRQAAAATVVHPEADAQRAGAAQRGLKAFDGVVAHLKPQRRPQHGSTRPPR